MFNPFEVLGLEKSYALEPKILEKAYFDAQKKNHPDRFVGAGEEKKKAALDKSTALNQAYLLLKDPLKRATYMLQAAGTEPLSHHSETLAQALEWREQIEEGKDLAPELSHSERTLLKDVETGFAIKDYEKVRLSLYQLTYIQNLLREVKDRNHASSDC